MQREAAVELTWLLRDQPICPDLPVDPKSLTAHYVLAVFGVLGGRQ